MFGRVFQRVSLSAGALLLACSSIPLAAYEISGSKWRGGSVEFYVSIAGTSPSGTTWQESFLAAIDDWQDNTIFEFDVIEQALDPCLDDGLNSVDFTDDVCGSAYGAGTLAVTLRKYIPTLLGEAELFEADVVISNEVNYDIYDGRLYPPGNNNLDFRRVAIHELGHVLGLEHEPNEPAIMAPSIGDLDRPTADDIAGVNALYSSLQTCAQSALVFGSVLGELAAGDCTVEQITGGGTDDSFIDIYRVDLASPATLSLTMESASLDSVLLIADLDLDIIDYDIKAGTGCSSSLSRPMPAGSYLILANTYDVQLNDDCAIEGDYRLSAHFESGFQRALGDTLTTTEVLGRGEFTGGASSNGGRFYKSLFTADEQITAIGEINVAPQDIGEAGFIMAAAITATQTYALNSDGKFVEITLGSGNFPVHRQGALNALETVMLLDRVVPASLSIDELDVDFVIGYGLSQDPATVFYNSEPIKMVITPAAP